MVLEPSETGEVFFTMPADALQAESLADLALQTSRLPLLFFFFLGCLYF